MTNEQYAIMAASLARIEATVNYCADRLDSHVEEDKTIHADVELRLRSVEGWKSRVLGAAAAVAAGISYLFTSK